MHPNWKISFGKRFVVDDGRRSARNQMSGIDVSSRDYLLKIKQRVFYFIYKIIMKRNKMCGETGGHH